MGQAPGGASGESPRTGTYTLVPTEGAIMTMTVNVDRPTDARLLRFAMRADGVGTAVAGVALMAAAAPLAGHIGLSTHAEYVAGVVFLICGLGGFMLAALPSLRWPGIGMVLANVVATIAAPVIVLADWLPLTTLGVGVFAASAVYTTIMGCLQYLGVRRLQA